jgi:IS5 family transposase
MEAARLLGKNWLKVTEGDALYALLCGDGHNVRMILRRLRVLYCALLKLIAMAITAMMGLTMGASPQDAAISRRPALTRG